MLRARMSDNVLNDGDFTVVELTLHGGRVVEQRLVQQGAYTVELSGRDLEELARWTQHDDTGNHPENFHEIDDGSGFRSFWTAAELRWAARREGKRS